MFETTKY